MNLEVLLEVTEGSWEIALPCWHCPGRVDLAWPGLAPTRPRFPRSRLQLIIGPDFGKGQMLENASGQFLSVFKGHCGVIEMQVQCCMEQHSASFSSLKGWSSQCVVEELDWHALSPDLPRPHPTLIWMNWNASVMLLRLNGIKSLQPGSNTLWKVFPKEWRRL